MYLFIDTETGGLTPKQSLLTVSCILADKDFNIVPVDFYSPGLYLQLKHEEYVLTAGALSVNKIDVAAHHSAATDLQDAQTILKRFIQRAIEVVGKKRLVPAGHNVAFDVQFIRAYLLDDVAWNQYFTYPAFDTAAVARFLNAANAYSGGYSLTALRDRFLPDARNLTMHNAEIDNLVAIELAKKFVSFVPRQNT